MKLKQLLAGVLVSIVASCALPPPVYAAEEARNPAMIRLFKETHECPATGKTAVKGKASSYVCPGYVVDHGIPFCAGQYLNMNFDQAYNMSYQKHDKENSLRKDQDEVKLCNALKSLTQIPQK